MSRIGKKPIPLPQGVKFEVKGNTVVVQGPKGQVQTHLPAGVKLKQADGHIQVTREGRPACRRPRTGARPGEQRRGRRDQGLERATWKSSALDIARS